LSEIWHFATSYFFGLISCHIIMVMVSLNGMKEMTVPIDQAGRIVLPKDVRRELAIKPGDTFKLSLHGSSVTLTPNKEATGFVRKGRALVFSTASDVTLTQEVVNDILEEGRDERLEQSLQRFRAPKRRA
jgi:AbrB family looped-hinge helix DNA binding protein